MNSTKNTFLPAAFLFSGIMIGLTAAFYMDPITGRRRRALVQDKAFHWRKVAGKLLVQKSHHIQNRMHGYKARMGFY